MKVSEINTKKAKLKRDIEKNERMQKTFEKGLKEIDSFYKDIGHEFVKPSKKRKDYSEDPYLSNFYYI